MDYVSREAALRARALAVLGFACPSDKSPLLPEKRELHYRYHCRMLRHHPDRNPGDARAHDIAALLNEAFALLSGKAMGRGVSLLEDEVLVRCITDAPVSSLDNVPTYEQWLRDQFYDVRAKSIWSYGE
jgi:hypothetical protein